MGQSIEFYQHTPLAHASLPMLMILVSNMPASVPFPYLVSHNCPNLCIFDQDIKTCSRYSSTAPGFQQHRMSKRLAPSKYRMSTLDSLQPFNNDLSLLALHVRCSSIAQVTCCVILVLVFFVPSVLAASAARCAGRIASVPPRASSRGR